MNCICGCGTSLGRGQVELNLVAGEVAVELVVWDKARTLGPAVAGDEVAALLNGGAQRYQSILVAIHAGDEPGEEELAGTQAWLVDSRAARLRLHDDLPVPKRKISLSAAEQERIDRRHPERSFSGAQAAGGEESVAAEQAAGGDRYLEALLATALEDVRVGRAREAEEALRRFLSERS